MPKYWVVGGEYKNTKFEDLAPGKEEERFGPYLTLEDARRHWSALAMSTVDNAHIRYSIEHENSAEFYVVGGRYIDTDFQEIRGGGQEERFGPYETEQAAMKKWRELAWSTVDDAFSQYRIERV